MSGYVQRLLDRAGPATRPVPHAEPSGRSLSPIAEADQRLNDPEFVPRAGALSGLHGDHDLGPARVTDDRLLTRRRGPVLHPATDRTPSARAVEHDDAPVDVRPRMESPLRRHDPPAPAVSPPQAIGAVVPGDFVPVEPEPGEDVVPSDPTSPRPVAERVIAPDATSDAVSPDEPRAAAPERAAVGSIVDRRAVETAGPMPDAVPHPTPAPTQPAPQIATWAVEATPRDRAADPAPSARDAQRSPVDVAQPVSPPPPVPPSPVPAPRQVTDSAARTRPHSDPGAAPEPRREAPIADQQVPPVGTTRRRPMTASEASVIGPLAHRRRAMTLAGQRRR